MVVGILGLLILVQLPSIYVTSSMTCSMVCGGDRVTYSCSLEQELFYINEHAVDIVSFCKSIECYNPTGCFSGSSLKCRRVAMNYCGLDLSLVELPQRAGRKVLLGSRRNESIRLSQKNHPREDDSFSSPKTMAMALPGMLLLCCGLLCPCFRPRRKETARTTLSKDPNSMDSSTPLGVKTTSEKVPESPHRIPGSPLRVPGSPLRVPGSPLRVPPSPSHFSMSPQLSRIGSVHLSMSQVIKATHNFSQSLQIGEGGFGTVYRAKLQDGQVVAIKRAKKEHLNTLHAEFSSEVELLAKIDHRNLVKLLGYVDKGNERIIITEYVPNGTLREHLDGQHGKILDFSQRLEISIGVGHALTYLHQYAEKQIIHRDVKSSNILLTESLRAKVADFGFARLGPVDADQTHISTKVKGTVGYLDPEYLKTYQLTPKSDVYSFGILMIEILTGRRPVEMRRAADERVTVRWAFKNYNEGNISVMLDPLMTEVVEEEILSKMFGLAFQCAAPTRSDRPNMKEVGEQLWVIRMDYVRSVSGR